MISYETYKVIHLLGIFFIFTALGGLALHAANGGSRDTNRGRKLTAITHGVGLLVVLVAGFGLLARLGISNPGTWPAWMWGKVVIWLALGGATALIGRNPALGKTLWFVFPVLGAIAGWLALNKPV